MMFKVLHFKKQGRGGVISRCKHAERATETMGILNKWRRKQFSMSYKTLHLDFGFSVLKSWGNNPWVMRPPYTYKVVKMEPCRLGGKANHLSILPLVCGYTLAWQWIDHEFKKNVTHQGLQTSKWKLRDSVHNTRVSKYPRGQKHNYNTLDSIIRHSSSYTGVTVTTGIYSICRCSAITALSHAGWDSSSHTVICNQ